MASRLAAAWCRTADFLNGQKAVGFTHVAGNPPFQRRGGSAADICVSFVEKSFHALVPGGRLAMIAPLSIASATGAARLRRKIEEEGVFEGVEVLLPEKAFLTRVSVVSGLFVAHKGRDVGLLRNGNIAGGSQVQVMPATRSSDSPDRCRCWKTRGAGSSSE